MEARQRMHNNAGNLMAHDSGATQARPQRTNGTYSSNFSFADQQATNQQNYDHKGASNRNKQFTNTPLCSAATRQSYQDSNIFGTKGENSETVQKSAAKPKDIRQRANNTYARSNVMATDAAAVKQKDGQMHAPVARKASNWQSNIFAEPKIADPTRKKLGRADNGRAGLYGDNEGSSSWQKKTSFAAAMSQKEKTKPPKFDDQHAQERKNQELYGNSQYKPATPVKQSAAPSASGGDHRKARKAAQLQSNILTHADEGLRAERDAATDMSGQSKGDIGSAQGGWAAQSNLSKAKNSGGIDTYKQKQNQLGSSVLAQTDYSNFAPLQRSKIDMDNIYAKGDQRKELAMAKKKKQATPQKEYAPDENRLISRPANSKANMNQSANDTHSYAPVQVEQAQELASPVVARHPNKNKALTALSSSIGGADPNRFYGSNIGTGEVLDFDITNLPENADEIMVKKQANVKHVISTEVQYDNMKGVCKGEGRIKIRLNEGETQESVKANFQKAGIIVKEHKEDPRKKPHFSGPPKEDKKNKVPGNNKAAELNKKAF